VRNWKLHAVRREIQLLDAMDQILLPLQVANTIQMAEEFGISFWDQVLEYRGEYGLRMLIHCLLVAKGVR
jgi:hypothetical protein